eukprot:Phypoly_transcript_22046.p1 GENE.Phypoly_transcript_22046~~Phypoly_transcript_22046.p1  ORF type:complete len:115 (-),score=15.11 Phypoly_transcript_22046:111-455(-)
MNRTVALSMSALRCKPVCQPVLYIAPLQNLNYRSNNQKDKNRKFEIRNRNFKAQSQNSKCVQKANQNSKFKIREFWMLKFESTIKNQIKKSKIKKSKIKNQKSKIQKSKIENQK